MGRPKEIVSEKVDLEQVEKLASFGMTDQEIGWILGVTEMTINRWKKDELFLLALKKGKAVADQKVVECLFKRATGYDHKSVKFFQYEGQVIAQEFIEHHPPDVTAQIFWLKNRRREDWKDRWEVTGADGKSVFDGILYQVMTTNGNGKTNGEALKESAHL